MIDIERYMINEYYSNLDKNINNDLKKGSFNNTVLYHLLIGLMRNELTEISNAL